MIRRRDAVLPVVALSHAPVLAHHHRGHGLAALNRRDVEALDPPRNGRQRQRGPQRFQRVVLRKARVDEPRLIRHLRIAIRQLDQAALLTTLRHQHLHPAPRAFGQPGFEQLAILRRARQMHFRRRRAILVELLHRRLQNLGGGSRHAFVRGQLHPLQHSAFAHEEHVHHGARGTHVEPEGIAVPNRAVAIFCWRSFSVCTVRAASRRCAASSNRSAPAAAFIESVRRPISSSSLPSKNSCVRWTASPYCSAVHNAATHGAMQRLMSYSRQGRSRIPVITSLHDRIPKSRCVNPIVLRASDAGMKGPA